MKKLIQKALGKRHGDGDDKIDWLKELFARGVRDTQAIYELEKRIGDIARIIADGDEKTDWVKELFTKGVDDDRGNYELEKCIGDAEGAKVYKAAYTANQADHRTDVALKVTLVSDEGGTKKRKEKVDVPVKFSRSFKKLEEEVWESFLEGNQEDGDGIENIIGVKNCFVSNHFLCVSMPLFEEGSLRYILSRRFPYGMPEDCVAIALRETARGLSHLHRKGLCHKNVNAGLIFVSRSPVRIRLAYEASNYYHNPDSSSTMTMINSYPVSVQNQFWTRNLAHPPEIGDPSDKNEYKTSADIWGLGLLALELFYGSLPEVSSHEDLKVMRDYVTEIQALPELKDLIIEMRRRKEAEREKSKKTVDQKMDMFDEFFAKSHSRPDQSKGEKAVGLHPSSSQIEGVKVEEDKEELGLHPNSPEREEVKAEEGKPKKLGELLNLKGPEIEEVKAEGSKSKKLWELLQEEREKTPRTTQLFKHFVSKCLALAPENRPAADELLNHPFLEDRKDLRYFEDVVLKGQDPRTKIWELRISS